MKIKDIITILNAQLLTPQADLEQEVHTACGSDMMSDVLAYVKDQSALITGLTNPQVVRTAEMMDMICIIFVRGKHADDTIVNLAAQRNIAILQTPYSMLLPAVCCINTVSEAGVKSNDFFAASFYCIGR